LEARVELMSQPSNSCSPQYETDFDVAAPAAPQQIPRICVALVSIKVMYFNVARAAAEDAHSGSRRSASGMSSPVAECPVGYRIGWFTPELPAAARPL